MATKGVDLPPIPPFVAANTEQSYTVNEVNPVRVATTIVSLLGGIISNMRDSLQITV